MDTPNRREARINQQRFSYTQNLDTLQTALFNCVKVEHREYISKTGEHKIYVQCHFANGSQQVTIDYTAEVTGLLNDFMHNTGVFSSDNNAPAISRKDASK